MQRKEYESLVVCPLDGRYSNIKDKLAPYFSEYALVKNRVFVEIEWLKFLLKKMDNDILNKFDKHKISDLDSIVKKFNSKSFERIKEIESTTNHDVKAVELFIDEKLETIGYELESFVHIGCTSEDINNVAYAKMIKEVLDNIWLTAALSLTEKINDLAKKYSTIPMLAHTHGQPATPTTVGKEFKVYSYRLKESIKHIKSVAIKAKFNGATGNYSAISVAFPEYNWQKLSKEFIEKLGFEFNPLTTQIEGHDYICHLMDGIRHFNNVLLGFDVDMWLYISMNYFKQIPVKDEIGSSTMPHKINPIKFENSEANIDMSNSICFALSNKLARSRMQRDLSDSSSKRNIGLAFGYSLQSIYETEKGLEKVIVNEEKINSDLNEKWEVLAEAIQTVLRKYGIPDAYNRLKDLTRGKGVSKEDILKFVQGLECLTQEDKQILEDMTPSSYVGLADILASE